MTGVTVDPFVCVGNDNEEVLKTGTIDVKHARKSSEGMDIVVVISTRSGPRACRSSPCDCEYAEVVCCTYSWISDVSSETTENILIGSALVYFVHTNVYVGHCVDFCLVQALYR